MKYEQCFSKSKVCLAGALAFFLMALSFALSPSPTTPTQNSGVEEEVAHQQVTIMKLSKDVDEVNANLVEITHYIKGE
jgi:hypothetical protein